MKKIILRIPIIGKFAIWFYRFLSTASYVQKVLNKYISWLFVSKETTNFTYDLSEINLDYLCALLSTISNTDFLIIKKYLNEITNNNELIYHLQTNAKNSKIKNIDKNPKYARRIGWYIIIRICKPKIVIETGVDKGLGACIIAEALRKNHEEGFDGYYYGTDINPSAGVLFSKPYNRYGEILIGDSIETLKCFSNRIDLFINDSDHSSTYERHEYEVIKNKLSKNAIILGDNAHITKELLNFSLENNRKFVFFKEEPINHWYPGAGIGISYTEIIKI